MLAEATVSVLSAAALRHGTERPSASRGGSEPRVTWDVSPRAAGAWSSATAIARWGLLTQRQRGSLSSLRSLIIFICCFPGVTGWGV